MSLNRRGFKKDACVLGFKKNACVWAHKHPHRASLAYPKSTNQNDIRKLGFEKDEARPLITLE